MNWKSLKNNKCPKCGSSLSHSMVGVYCNELGCDFRIRKEKFDKIVNDLYKPKTPQDNFNDLQNLGHKEVPEDFSDYLF